MEFKRLTNRYYRVKKILKKAKERKEILERKIISEMEKEGIDKFEAERYKITMFDKEKYNNIPPHVAYEILENDMEKFFNCVSVSVTELKKYVGEYKINEIRELDSITKQLRLTEKTVEPKITKQINEMKVKI
jgi:hypothetical protein